MQIERERDRTRLRKRVIILGLDFNGRYAIMSNNIVT